MIEAMRSSMSSERRPTISDVAHCYRLLLGREVENATVAGQQIAASKTVGDLFERIWHSQEAVRCRMGEAFGHVPALLRHGVTDGGVAAEQLARLWDETTAIWARRGLGSYHRWLGRKEPRFDDRNPKWNIERALAAGNREANELLGLCKDYGREIAENDRVAVFGAEAFRLGGGLAPLAARYVHFEVESGELKLGAQALRERGHANSTGAMISDLRGRPEQLDLFYSVSALQYAPPPMIADLLRRALRSLAPGGLLVCQLACQLHDYRFDLDEYLTGTGRDPMGEIHALAQSDVFSLIDTSGAVVLGALPDGRLGPLGLSFTFIARKRP